MENKGTSTSYILQMEKPSGRLQLTPGTVTGFDFRNVSEVSEDEEIRNFRPNEANHSTAIIARPNSPTVTPPRPNSSTVTPPSSSAITSSGLKVRCLEESGKYACTIPCPVPHLTQVHELSDDLHAGSSSRTLHVSDSPQGNNVKRTQLEIKTKYTNIVLKSNSDQTDRLITILAPKDTSISYSADNSDICKSVTILDLANKDEGVLTVSCPRWFPESVKIRSKHGNITIGEESMLSVMGGILYSKNGCVEIHTTKDENEINLQSKCSNVDIKHFYKADESKLHVGVGSKLNKIVCHHIEMSKDDDNMDSVD